MARLRFPDSASIDRVQATAGTALLSAAGATSRVYVDAAGTQLADIQNGDGSANATATLTLDSLSRLPEFLGPTSGVDVLYVRVDGGAPLAVEAQLGQRFVAQDAAIAADLETFKTDERAFASGTFVPSEEEGRRTLRRYGTKLHQRTTGGKPHVKIVLLLDSVSNLKWRGLAEPLIRAMGGGNAGVSISAGASGTGWVIPGLTANATSGTVTTVTTAYDEWFTGEVTRFAAGASRTYGQGGGNGTWDSAKLYFIKKPGGGTFHLEDEVGTNLSGTVSAVATGIELGIVSVTATAGTHLLKVVCDSGEVDVVGPAWSDSRTAGVIFAAIGRGGLAIQDAMSTTTGRATLQAFLADFAPDIVSFEAKESVPVYADGLAKLFGLIRTAAPLTDLLAIASTPVGDGQDDAAQIEQNKILREAAKTHGAVFYDSYTPAKDYATFKALGGITDGVHPDDPGNFWLGGLMARDLGLFDHPGLDDPWRLTTEQITVLKQIVFGLAGSHGSLVLGASGNFGLTFTGSNNLVITGANGKKLQLALSSGGDDLLPPQSRLGETGVYLSNSGSGTGASLRVVVQGGATAPLSASRISGSTYVRGGAFSTAGRPTGLTAGDIGAMIFDTSLNKPVFWNGGAWVDASGTAA